MTNQQYKENAFVWLHKTKQKGKIIAITRGIPAKYKVEVIVSFDKDKQQRVTQVLTVGADEISPYREKKSFKSKKDTLLFAKVRPTATIPSKNHEDAGYDIYCDFEETELIIKPNEIKLIPTGIASSMSPKYVLVVKERGLTGVKGMSVRAGIIDSGFRNEIFVPINNTSDKIIVITKNKNRIQDTNELIYPYDKAIAQLLLLPVPDVNVKEIAYEELQQIPSKRGLGMLGSSNK